MSIQIGDWVNSYSKGIYRVERVLEQYYEEYDVPPPGKQVGDRYISIVSKRLLNSKFKKSLDYESCSDYFVKPLDATQKTELQKVLDEKPELLKVLDDFEIPVLVSLYNRELQIDTEADLATVGQLIEFIKAGRTFIEIENEMARLDLVRLKPKYYGNYLFQLINFNEEYREKRKIWRDATLTAK